MTHLKLLSNEEMLAAEPYRGYSEYSNNNKKTHLKISLFILCSLSEVGVCDYISNYTKASD